MSIKLAILNEKGGVGKTTLATNLAYCLSSALENKQKVVLVDADPQGSSRDWSEASGGKYVQVVGMDRETLEKDIKIVSDEFNWIIIDGAPQIENLSVAAIRTADIILVPVQPSPYDVWGCAKIVRTIKERQEITNGKLKAAFVISRAIKNTKLSREVMAPLLEYDLPILKSKTHDRVIYPTMANEGKTVFQGSDQAAIDEITSITMEAIGMLQNDH